jgi:hypothetical protein
LLALSPASRHPRDFEGDKPKLGVGRLVLKAPVALSR